MPRRLSSLPPEDGSLRDAGEFFSLRCPLVLEEVRLWAEGKLPSLREREKKNPDPERNYKKACLLAERRQKYAAELYVKNPQLIYDVLSAFIQVAQLRRASILRQTRELESKAKSPTLKAQLQSRVIGLELRSWKEFLGPGVGVERTLSARKAALRSDHPLMASFDFLMASLDTVRNNDPTPYYLYGGKGTWVRWGAQQTVMIEVLPVFDEADDETGRRTEPVGEPSLFAQEPDPGGEKDP
jgi:hypothetical protein